MALFQQTILNKYLSLLSKETLSQQWKAYQQHFLNPTIQQNIRNSKEEQYQGEFLFDLFVNILGYTKNPSPNFNLTTELKNVKDSKKADGGIIISGKVVAVIELKGTNTTDLNKIETQAFGYKNNQPDCVYVITSNFEKLRFYIDNAIEHIEFNLFTLTETQFAQLYLLLSYEQVAKNIPQKIKHESLSQEDVITQKLYKDYALFKRELYQDLITHNSQLDPLHLFQKTQKLLDRFLFLFFAEDRLLLPPNSVRTILNQWQKLKDLDAYIPLYQRFKQYFGYLNTGFKSAEIDVFPYNGGLFRSDLTLDSLHITDELLYRHTLKIAEYDFNSEIDVNILGHIFENSLNELDEIKAQMLGQQIDKAQTKRKKEGVFYTPKYITQYIVANTIGKLCQAQKEALKLQEEAYFYDKKRNKKQKEALLVPIEAYRKWLLQLTILDPACGSGAFLNEALNFLMAEHQYIDELQAKVFGDALLLSNIENTILENNLFGVDLNEESVEIAKLSLWLHTAQPQRKLNDLSHNIKCGNSLIDNVLVAGEKAFDWQKEFPQVFAKGGFDVIIGNPPYGVNFTETEKKYLTNFDNLVPDFEIYIYFISLYKKLLKKEGILSYIFPNTFLSTLFGKKYREFIFNNVQVYQIIDLSYDNTFVDASVRTCIFSFIKHKQDYECELFKLENKLFTLVTKYNKQEILEQVENILSLFSQNTMEKQIIQKIQKNKLLKEFHEVSQGYIPYRRSDLIKVYGEIEGNKIVDEKLWHSTRKIDESWKQEITGKNINRYTYEKGKGFIKYGTFVASYVNPQFFTQTRILIREITADKLFCAFIEEEFYNNPSLINVINKKQILDLKYLLVVLNSKLIGWLHNKISPKANKGLFPKILINDVRNIPLVELSIASQQPFITLAEKMLSLQTQLQNISQQFERSLQREFSITETSKKLQTWYKLSYKDFLAELEKKKIKLSLSQKAEWETYFSAEQQKAVALLQSIHETDAAIDKKVYALYDLNEAEIEIVEKS